MKLRATLRKRTCRPLLQKVRTKEGPNTSPGRVRTKGRKKMGLRALVMASATAVALVGGLLPVGAAPAPTDGFIQNRANLTLSDAESDASSEGISKRSRPRAKVDKNEWEGFLSCGFRSSNANFICGSWDPRDDRVLTLEADPGLKTIVVGMVWDPPTFSLQPHLLHSIFVNVDEVTGDNYTFRDDAALSGLEYRLDANRKNPMLDWDNLRGPIPIEFRVGVGSEGEPNLVLQQPFTVHYHLFYGKRAPKRYSALP
jgi:hypothetical protein